MCEEKNYVMKGKEIVNSQCINLIMKEKEEKESSEKGVAVAVLRREMNGHVLMMSGRQEERREREKYDERESNDEEGSMPMW